MTRTGKIVSGILILLNVVLLVQNYYIRKSLSKSTYKYKDVRSEFYEFGGEGKLLNPLSYLYNNIELSPEYRRLQNNPIFLLVLFDDHGCPACIEHHVNHLNQLPKELQQYVMIIYNGRMKGYLDSYKPKFKYYEKNSEQMVFNKKLDFPKPMAFLIVDNIIYMLHRTETDSNLKTDLFYERCLNLLDKIYNRPG